MESAKTYILSLAEPDEEREFAFELEYMRSLTQEQRDEMMRQIWRLTEQMLAAYERRTGLKAIRDISLRNPDLGVRAWLTATLTPGGKRA